MSTLANAHTVILGLLRRPMAEVIEQARKVVALIPDLQPAGHYRVSRWSDDGAEHEIIAQHKYADRRALPAVPEAPTKFNQVSYPLYADGVPGYVAEMSLLIRSYPESVSVDFIFMGNALEGLGASWIIKTLDAFLPPMGIESGILCDLEDTGTTINRVVAGEPLTDLIAARLKGKDPLPPPLLAVVKAERVDPEVWDAARDGGVNIRMTPKGFAVFLTVKL